jgi:uncharacterized phage protein gp47/JayE
MTSFVRPTRAALIDRIKSDLNGRVTGADSRLRRNVLGALATAEGGAIDGAYGYQAYVADQVMPDSADEDHLVRWAAIWGVTPKGPTQATGPATGTGTDPTPLPSGAVMTAGDGSSYVTTVDVDTAGGVVSTTIQAQTPGAAGNLAAGVQLTLAVPIEGLGSQFVVGGGGMTGGNDAETPDELLARLLQRIQTPPMGGAQGDYVTWALQVPGVTRAWEYPLRGGLGTVGLTFVFDDREVITPLDGDVTAMQAWLTQAGYAPVTATVIVFACTLAPINFTIAVSPPGNATVQAAVQAELADLFVREAVPETVLAKSHYDLAIALAQGVTDHTVSAPPGNITPAAGQLPTLGVITWA